MDDTARSAQATPGDASCPTPEELLVRVASGDQEAFGELYEVIAGPAFGLARRVVRDEAQAQEVCQEALLEVWGTAARFDPAHGDAASWAMTITHRRAVDHVRSTQAAAAAAHDRPPVSNQVREENEAHLECEWVRRYLRALTPIQRESVLLTHYDTYRETAEQSGTALGTVKTRMREGLIRLRDCLGVT